MTQLSDPHLPQPKPSKTRSQRGLRAYHAGLSAENGVLRHYEQQGAVMAARRWRGQGGEIDLICHQGDLIIFVEVKASRSFDAAAHSLSQSQMRRIHAAASEYLGTTAQGQLSEVRFDLALVDGSGIVQIIENAFGHF